MDICAIEKVYAEKHSKAKKMRVSDIIELSNVTDVIVEGIMGKKKETLEEYIDGPVTSYHFELKDVDMKDGQEGIRVPCTNRDNVGLNTMLSLSEDGDTLTLVGEYFPEGAVLKVNRVVNHKYLAKKKSKDVGF